MKGKLNTDVASMMQSANYIISRITLSVCALNDAQAEAGFGRPEKALNLIRQANHAISGTNKMIFDLALKMHQAQVDAEDALLAAQSLEGDAS